MCCVVYGKYFYRTNVDYAILNLSTNLPYGVSAIRRYFDNEDNNNVNWTKLNGSNISGWYGDCHFGSNTRLSWYYYPKTTSSSPWPTLGLTWGVLGRFSTQGSIYFDDEDRNNINWCYLEKWNDNTYTWDSGYSGNIPNIMDVGSNTRLYICF